METLKITEIMQTPTFAFLKKRGWLNETKLRNYQIHEEYFALRKTQNATDTIFQLMGKYNLGYDSIFSAVFRK